MMREVWQFLGVLLAAIAFGCAIVYWMVREDAVTKEMRVNQILLAPETIETLSNRAVATGKGRPAEYLIESIQFIDQGITKQVDISSYAHFFSKIQGDIGVIDPPESLLQSFQTASAPKLAINMKHFAPFTREGKGELFQQLEINSDGNAYRINLHVDTGAMQWVYFTHPHVLDRAREIFLGK